MYEFLEFLGFKTRSVTAKRTRDVSSGLIADLFYEGTLDLFAPWMEQEETREKYYLLFDWVIASETRPHTFKYPESLLFHYIFACDLLNDPLLRKFKDIKHTQSNGPSSALKTAFKKALSLDFSNLGKALDEYCKTKELPEQPLQPEVVGLFSDFKDYYCKSCYIRSPPGGTTKKRISTCAKIKALSKGVCNLIESELGIKFSVFLAKKKYLGFEISRKKGKGVERNIEESARYADILLNGVSKLLKLPKNSSDFHNIRAQSESIASAFATYGGPLVILWVYYELFRPKNRQAKQAEPSNFPIDNVGIHSVQFGKDLKPIISDQNLALDNSDTVHVDQDQDSNNPNQYLVNDYAVQGLVSNKSDQDLSKKPRPSLLTFEDALRNSFMRVLKIDIHEFIDFLKKNSKKTLKVLIFKRQYRTTDNYFCF